MSTYFICSLLRICLLEYSGLLYQSLFHGPACRCWGSEIVLMYEGQKTYLLWNFQIELACEFRVIYGIFDMDNIVANLQGWIVTSLQVSRGVSLMNIYFRCPSMIIFGESMVVMSKVGNWKYWLEDTANPTWGVAWHGLIEIKVCFFEIKMHYSIKSDF